jgi:hypothetical protein
MRMRLGTEFNAIIRIAILLAAILAATPALFGQGILIPDQPYSFSKSGTYSCTGPGLVPTCYLLTGIYNINVPQDKSMLDLTVNVNPGKRSVRVFIHYGTDITQASSGARPDARELGSASDGSPLVASILAGDPRGGDYLLRPGTWTIGVYMTFSLISTVSTSGTVVASLSPKASRILTSSAGGSATSSTIGSSGTTKTGYATVSTNGAAPYATAVFGFMQNGVTISEAGVPASPPTRWARIFVDYRSNVSAVPAHRGTGTVNVNTGIAVVNPGSSTAHVTYTLRDSWGNILTIGNGTVAAANYFACYIDSLKDVAASDFNLPADFQNSIRFASLDISSDQPLSVLALRGTANERDDFLITTTPVADLSKLLDNSPIYFPQFVDGGGYTTSLIFMNTSNQTETGSFQIMNRNGNPLAVTRDGGEHNYTFNYSILPGGVYHFQTDGFPAEVAAGWVRLTPGPGSSAPIGSGVFGYSTAAGLVSESGIPSAAATTHARVYVDLSGNHDTGLAIANITASAANITINAFQNDGVTPAGTTLGPFPFAGNGYNAAFANSFISGLPAKFTGVLDISSTTSFAALTLRSLNNERDEFLMSTFPIADMNQAAPSPIVFPQIADGGGYVTQFILLSPGGASNVTLSFYDKNGLPLAVGR